jgi:hypothetical protein
MSAGYVQPPATLPGFPRATKSKAKTPFAGGKLRRRWKDPDGTIYEWDYRHGRVEKYDPRGNHQGEYDPYTGQKLSDADPTQKVEP